MTIYYSNFLRSGLKVLFEKQPCRVESVEFVKPGKGQSFSRVKLRKLLTNQLIVKTLRSTDYLLHADILEVKLIYIYNDNQFWYFMDKLNFDQFSLPKEIIKDNYKWLVEQKKYLITFWNDEPILLTVDKLVNLKVVSEVIKSDDDFSNSDIKHKFCKLCTGVIIKVPTFIKVGDIIKVDTRTETYCSRINNSNID